MSNPEKSLREEFEESIIREFCYKPHYELAKKFALFGAKLAIERCAKMADELRRLNTNPDELAHDIRQLAKELS